MKSFDPLEQVNGKLAAVQGKSQISVFVSHRRDVAFDYGITTKLLLNLGDRESHSADALKNYDALFHCLKSQIQE